MDRFKLISYQLVLVAVLFAGFPFHVPTAMGQESAPADLPAKVTSSAVATQGASAVCAQPCVSGENYGSASWWTAYLTGALALVTLVLAIYTARLFRATVNLGKESKSTSVRQAQETAQSLQLAETSVASAQASNKIARDALIANHRAWLRVEVGIGGNLHYNVNGLNVAFEFHIQNVGKSPAVKVFTDIAINVMDIDSGQLTHDEELLALIARSRERPAHVPLGVTIFPGETLIQRIQTSLSVDQLSRLTKQHKAIFMKLLGTVTYRLTYDDEAVHQTSVMYDIRRSDSPRPETTAEKRSPSAISIDDGDIPASDLRLVRWISVPGAD